ncbi:hypothetical protein [Cryobacterium sp. PH31-O1]|uniref:hypothetical protein n=1 Tax=Cryobacterium sp. PH31-O1 TaxID=3046306 RepID=UPI0024BAEF6B|nr:hypothetical protein [Cryobacterium sp. PH31-O1]MDJ0339792.1 hypothetical protein [Cryobacterium sp. PH31-O1]
MSSVSAGLEGGDLLVSVGGTTIVATDAILAQSQFLDALHADATDWARRAYRIRNLDPMRPANWLGQDPWPDLVQAAGRLHQLAVLCSEVASYLRATARNYGYAERLAQELALLNAASIAHDLGRFLRAGLFALSGTSIGVTVTGILALDLIRRHGTTHPASAVQNGSARGLEISPRLLTNAATVSLVRIAASSIDDAAAGFGGTPRSVGITFGDEGLGLIGVSQTALGVLAAARGHGLLQEGAVNTAAVGAPTRANPPTGTGDLAARIPKSVPGQPQVRIERYGTPESPSWAVYIGGTVDWDVVATTEPWDLTANVAALAGENAGSFSAVIDAMKAAGIAPADPVVLAGHSQGGLVATQVAAYAWFNVQAVATFGAPESKVPVPPGVATLTVEHTDDVVTAMGGDSLIDSDDRLLVRREAFAVREPPPGTVLPAHDLNTYQETARMIDASPEENLTDFRDAVTGVLGSEPGEAVLWRGIRLPEGPTPQ